MAITALHNPLVELPIELGGEIVGKWSCLKDVVRLDTAFCETSTRTVLHENIFWSPACVLNEGLRLRRHTARLMDWVAARNIRTQALHMCDGNNMTISKKHLRKFGELVRCASLRGMYENYAKSTAVMSLVAKHCGNLKAITCDNWPVCSTFADLLNTCTGLETLIFKETDTCDGATIPQELINVPATHHLKLKLVNIECDELAAACIFKMCAPGAVLHLRLPANRTIPEWRRYTSLRSLGFCGSTQLDDQLLFHILTQCPWIVNLDISNTVLITDNGVADIAPVVQQLRSINLEAMQGLSDAAVHQIVRYHGHSLEALYLLGCSYVSSHYVAYAISQCPRLKTVSFDRYDYGHAGRMASLTTVITSYDMHNGLDWCNVAHTWLRVKHLHVVVDPHAQHEFTLLEAAAGNLPALQTLCLVNVSQQDVCTKLSVLREKKPKVRVVIECKGDWYTQFQTE